MKELIEQIRFIAETSDSDEHAALNTAADALEALTKPVDMEPVAWISRHCLPIHTIGAEVSPVQLAKSQVPLYSAEQVARRLAVLEMAAREELLAAIEGVTAERDELLAENAALKYSLQLDEDLIGKIQEIIHVLSIRPTVAIDSVKEKP